MFLKGTLHIRLHTQIRLHSSRQNFSIRAACEGYFPIKVDFLAIILSAKSNPGETAQLTSAKSEKYLEVTYNDTFRDSTLNESKHFERLGFLKDKMI